MAARGDDVVIASAKMKYKEDEVDIYLFSPKLAFPDSDQYSCAFSIKGGPIEYSGKSIGFDSMQSLILSLKKIGTFLEKSDELDKSLIKWEGGPMDFPVFENL